jgi:hypothetical protein
MEDIIKRSGWFPNGGDYQVAGDDGVLYFKETPNFKFRPKKFIAWCKKNFDMNIEITNFGKTISSDPDKSLTFNKLCYYFDEFGNFVLPTVQPSLLLKRLKSPARNSDKTEVIQQIISGSMDQPVTDFDSKRYLGLITALYRTNTDNGIYNVHDTRLKQHEAMNTIGMISTDLYFTASSSASLYDETSLIKTGDARINSFSNDELVGKSANPVFVENWIYDNLDKYYGLPPPSVRSRYNWFISQLGSRKHLMRIIGFSALKRQQLIKAGVSRKIFKRIDKSFDQWENLVHP